MGARELERDLASLRKGAGVLHPQLNDRVGPELRRVAGIGRQDDHELMIVKMGDLVEQLKNAMDDRLLLILRGELNLDPAGRSDRLTDRREFLGSRLRLSTSAVRKLGATACRTATYLLAIAPSSDGRSTLARSIDQWSLGSLRVVLFLNDPLVVTSMERRVVIFEQDDFDRVCIGVGFPALGNVADDRSQVEISVEFGAELIQVSRPTKSYLEYEVRFTRTFAVGGRAEFGTVVRLSSAAMKSSYIFSPLRPCREFDLRVKFAPDRAPRAVWLVDGVPGRSVDSLSGAWVSTRVDSLGEVYHGFRSLRPGLGYGFRWEW